MLGQKNVRAEKWNPINNNQACLERYPLILFFARPFFATPNKQTSQKNHLRLFRHGLPVSMHRAVTFGNGGDGPRLLAVSRANNQLHRPASI